NGSILKASQGITPWETFDLKVEGGAGGTQQAPGDYFYGDLRHPFNAVGLWGLQRVLPNDNGKCPILRVDGNTCVFTAPSAPGIGTPSGGNASALARWTTPASTGGSPVTGYSVKVVNATTHAQIGALRPASAGVRSTTVIGLVNGTAVRFQVQARNTTGAGAFSALSAAVTPMKVPGAPVIGRAGPGAPGGPVNALARWTPPVSNGGSAINGYLVNALRMNAAGAVVATVSSPVQAASARLLLMNLPKGSYRFRVRARNGVALGPSSVPSNLVISQ
ncbi:MAG: hypothetical protein QOE58_2195, partial [Actinomycetota bacterium]|nr:hypothetical protein [Actinomycetota bacterium]